MLSAEATVTTKQMGIFQRKVNKNPQPLVYLSEAGD